MTPTHHLPEDLLAVYAAGTCGEPEALFVATHLTLCKQCRDSLAVLESIGGHTIETVTPMNVGVDVEALLARAETAPSATEDKPDAKVATAQKQLADTGMPSVLAPYMPEGLKWRFLAPGVKQVELSLRWNDYPARLVKFPPGYVVPLHTHPGSEYTIVLTGAFEDGADKMQRGDVEVRDEAHRHELRITKDAQCLCLFIADSAPVPLTWLGRILRPFLG
jgi:putative transcriptional regulator